MMNFRCFSAQRNAVGDFGQCMSAHGGDIKVFLTLSGLMSGHIQLYR